MGSFVDRIRGFALALGGPGLFIVAFLDSSFLSLPEINDLLPARRQAVEDAPRDDEVAARIVVAEGESEQVIAPRDEHAAEHGRDERCSREPRASGC